MYLPTDGLYAEVARIPGLLDTIGREHHVIVLGPSLFPALLRTIHLGHITLSLEQKAEEVRRLLGITRGEMQKIDGVLEKLSNQASTMAKNLTLARRRTRAVEKTLTNVVTIEGPEAESILGLAEEQEEETE
jgi:DNA recombination protein RmuC